ncbi:MAG: HAD hydrolase family protein [Bacteroidales bacterium]|jgi:3-deoxy-D-manno-octulosonate 8-phosphate phosphatase (KDO 8-P phosphatase)|nr:HAD hydrolase family protein [Bacteroidales bacterium]
MENILKGIKAFVFDVDGVLTDGGIFANLDGELLRTFDSKDGFALRMAYMHGYRLGVISGGRSESIRKRVQQCGMKAEDVYLGSRDKIEDFEDFCRKHDLGPEEVMYFGDDLPDIPVMTVCGCGVAPSDAVDDVIEAADHVSTKPGGKGCVRETIEMVMKLQGTWELDVQDYKRKF